MFTRILQHLLSLVSLKFSGDQEPLLSNILYSVALRFVLMELTYALKPVHKKGRPNTFGNIVYAFVSMCLTLC